MRDLETGQGSRDHDLFRETVGLIRDSGLDILINLTAGMGGDLIVDDEDPSKMGAGSDMVNAETRMAHVEALRPDIATLDCGSINFSDNNYLHVQTPNM